LSLTRGGADGDPPGYPVQPAAHRLAPGNGAGLLEQDEEGGLEGVFRAGGVAQQAAADAPNQRAVALEQGGKGSLVLPAREALQELAILRSLDIARDRKLTEVRDDTVQLPPPHAQGSPAAGPLP